MKATAFVVVLSLVLLSTVAFAGESATQVGRTEASRAVSTDKSGISFIHSPASQGFKAEVPGLMNYQGTLTDPSGVALDTTVSMIFTIYDDSTGGSSKWTETQPSVQVSAGIFSVLLGRVNSIPDTVFKDPERWLGVQVGGDPELSPRQRIASVGYAFRAAEADTADFARSPAPSDGDWTITGSDMYSAVPGSVGIGTTNPESKLTVREQGANELQYPLRLTNPDNTAGTATGVLFETEVSDYGKGGLVYERKSSFARGDFHFLQRTSMDHDLPTLADAVVTVKNDGNVGIGVTNPTHKLQVEGITWTEGLELPASSGPDTNYVGVDGNFIAFGHSMVSEDFIGYKNQTFYFKDSPGGGDTSDPNVVIGGNVGIGTDSPGNKLYAYSSLNTPTVIYGEKAVGASSAAGVMGVSGTRSFGYLGGEMGTSTEPFSDFNYGVYGRTQEVGWGGFGGMFYNTSGNWAALAGDASVGYDYAVYGGHSGGNYGYLGGSGEGVYGYSSGGSGVEGYSSDIVGVYGSGNIGDGVEGFSISSVGVYGYSSSGFGVYGWNQDSANIGYIAGSDYSVYGEHSSGTYGYLGSSNFGAYGQYEADVCGILGGPTYGVWGQHLSNNRGILGYSETLANYLDHTELEANGDGQTAAFACRSRDVRNDGTGYGLSSSNTAIIGYSYWGDSYSFGTAGHNDNDYTRCGGVLGANSSGSYWGSLGYKNSSSLMYGGYFTSYTSGTGKSLDETALGIGMGAWGDLFGADIHGKVYGAFVEGGNYGLYSHGVVFMDDLNVHLQHTDDNATSVLYTNVSTDVTVQTSGFASLSSGKSTITFDGHFRSVVSPKVPIVVTVTPTGDCNGVHVLEVTRDGFTVAENNGGKSSVNIAFIAIGRRAGYENPQLAAEVISSDYVAKLSRGLHNDADTDIDGEGLYFEDGQLWLGVHPSTLPDPHKPLEEKREHRKVLEIPEQERFERARMDEEARRMEEEHQKRLEVEEKPRPVKRVPSRGNTSDAVRRSTDNK